MSLERFLDAQETVIAQVRHELAAGRKRTHWMWFVFPQIQGLGRSFTAQTYAISGIEEARAYLQHPQLGARLRECTQLVNKVENRTVYEIFGSPDDLKFHSSVTLFAEVGGTPEFRAALEKYFGGQPDPATLEKLGRV